ncbi:MAG: glycoside hydrolase family 38 C-terminal domain-containing protein [Candidatus Faecousia sp.]|nr:glycoside hydrolase family 38 C-terminal domain-containing protein [Candidatus Faecousia sp.]
MTIYDKIARMKPEQKNHWIDIPELSYWGERFFGELAVAQALAEGPEDEALLARAVDGLYDAFCRDGALTDGACQAAEAVLLPFGPRAREYTLHHVAHAHIDMDWMWGFHETVDLVLGTFRTILDLMDEYPQFTFSQSQCAVYRLTEFYDPQLFRRLKQRVEEGRFEFAGSAYVELDKNMPNLESMARHILYTKQYLHDRFGIPFEDVNLDFHPDSFGHAASVPEILNAGGIRYFYHCRGLDGEYLYRWQAPSGAEVLALNEPLWYNDSIRPMYLHQVPRFCKKYGVRDMMKIYGVGDHGGGPTRQDIERILDMQSWPVAPRIIFSTYKAYFAAIEPYRESFPVLTGELGPTFTGCYTSQSRQKLANRVAEDRLFMAEALTAFAAEHTGLSPFHGQLRSAWEKVLFNQFHDILPGSNTPDSREHAWGAFEEAMGSVMAASGAALRAFAQEIDTSAFDTPFEPLTSRSEGGGVGANTGQKGRFRLPGVERGRGKTRLIHFFNPTAFDRRQVLEATVWDWPGNPEQMEAFDASGNPLPCTAVTCSNLDWNHIRTDVRILAAVPALGYTTVRITEGEKQDFCFSALPPDPRVTYYRPLVLENRLVRVEFDTLDLSLKSYVNKSTGRELLGAQGGRFLLYREGRAPRSGQEPQGGCAWVEGVHMEPQDLHQEARLLSAQLTDSLSPSLVYELRHGKSTLQVTARLNADSPVLELGVQCRWREAAENGDTPKLCFRAELAWAPQVFRSDSQIGLQDRAPEPMHDWCGRDFLYAPGDGTGLALLTDSKYGYRGYDRFLQVSLLRSSSQPDPYPELGERNFRLGLAFAPDEPRALKALGSAFAHRDLPYASNTAHAGTLPLEGRFLRLTGEAALSAVKTAEDGQGLIVRLAALSLTEPASLTLALPGLRAAAFVDLAEQPLGPCPVEAEQAAFTLAPGQVKSLRLETEEGDKRHVL